MMYFPPPEKKDISKISVMQAVPVVKKSSGKKNHNRVSSRDNDKTPLRQFGQGNPVRSDPFKR